MSAPYAPVVAPASPTSAGEPVRGDLTRAGIIVVILAVLGALAGLLWAVWSPPGPRALVVRPGVFIPDETEAFVAGDGRYLVITTAIGVIAALIVWFQRPHRGVATLLGLAVGGLVGSLLTELVGHLTGGGTFDGKTNTIIDQLPLSLHAQGLLFVEPAVVTLVFGLLVAFAVQDDLGRPDPVRDRLHVPPGWAGSVGPGSAGPGSVGPGSVGAGAHPQDGGGYRDAPRPLQQGDLAAQQPREPDQPF